MKKAILLTLSKSEMKDILREVLREERNEQNSTKSGVEEHLTVKETAKTLKVTEQTIYEHIRKGTLVKKKFGNKTLITVESINKALKQYEPQLNRD